MCSLPFSSSSQSYPVPCHRIYVAFCSKDSGANTKFSNWLAHFDPYDNTWSYVSSIPGLIENHVLKDFSMISIGESIYLIGGRVYRKEKKITGNLNDPDDYIEMEIEVVPNVLCYNVRSDQWSNCAPLSMPRCNFACTVLENKIYVAGGQYEIASAKSTSSVEIYDPTTNKWTQMPSMRRLRYKCLGITWQGKVHVIGGFVDGCDRYQPRDCVERCSAEVYNEEKGQWDLVPGMWRLDVPPNQIVEIETRLFSSGDCLNVWKGQIEVYDGKLKLWNEVEGSQMKTTLCPLVGDHKESLKPLGRLYVTMAPIGPYLYFLAGYKVVGDTLSSNTTFIVHRFDTTAKEDVWTSFDQSQEEGIREFCSHCCVVTT